jgi:hypothetical protein
VERRTEPRFSIPSRVKATRLSSPDREIDCLVVDLSATGMRFITTENIPTDEIVVVDFADHLAVVNVRHCQGYGDKFSIGASRMQLVPKDQLPAGKPKLEQIRAMLEEKGWPVTPEVEVESVTEVKSPPVRQPAPVSRRSQHALKRRPHRAAPLR